MTDRLRETIARRFRQMLDEGMLRKVAIESLKQNFNVGRTSIYAYCKKFGVRTN